jgi:TatD DNase family protein
MRGKRNEPAFLSFTAEKMANLRSISLDELAEATTKKR